MLRSCMSLLKKLLSTLRPIYDFRALLLLAICLVIGMWGGKVVVISTHDGDLNPFNLLCEDIRKGQMPYALLKITFDDALAGGLYQRICLVQHKQWTPESQKAWRDKIIAFYGDAADEELNVIPRHGAGAYVPAALIERAQRGDAPVLRFEREDAWAELPDHLQKAEALEWCEEHLLPVLEALPVYDTYVGQDFARTGDLTSLWISQRQQDLSFPCVLSLEMRNIPYEVQKLIDFYVLSRLARLKGGEFDATGNGGYLAEVVAKRWPCIIKRMITVQWYQEITPKFKAEFERDALIMDSEGWQVSNDVPTWPGDVPEDWAYNVGKAARVSTEVERGQWEPVITSRDHTYYQRPDVVPQDKPKAQLGPTASSRAQVVEAVQKMLGGSGGTIAGPDGITVGITTKSLGQHLALDRAPVIPLLPEIIADPYEVWLMPRVKPISKREFEYLVYGLEAYSRPDTRVGRKGRPNEVSWASKSLTASVEDFSLDDPIPQDDIDQGGKDGINVTGLSTEYILSLIRLDRECRVADLVQNASSYNAANVQTLAGGQGLDNSEVNASKIINEILEKPIVRPNIGIMAVPEDAAAVAAKGALTLTGQCTVTGVVSLYIGGTRVRAKAVAGETLATTAARLAAAINADSTLPVTAVASADNAGLINLTCRWAGATGNALDVRLNYASEDVLPTGLRASITAMQDLLDGFYGLIQSGQGWEQALGTIRAINPAMAVTGAKAETLGSAMATVSQGGTKRQTWSTAARHPHSSRAVG